MVVPIAAQCTSVVMAFRRGQLVKQRGLEAKYKMSTFKNFILGLMLVMLLAFSRTTKALHKRKNNEAPFYDSPHSQKLNSSH